MNEVVGPGGKVLGTPKCGGVDLSPTNALRRRLAPDQSRGQTQAANEESNDDDEGDENIEASNEVRDTHDIGAARNCVLGGHDTSYRLDDKNNPRRFLSSVVSLSIANN